MLKSIKDVEIFAAGTWNGDEYTIADLDDMVSAFEANKNKYKPFIKLGHNKEQELLQKDGLPAAGWIGALKRVGEKLIADIVDMPQKVFELVQRRSYRHVSSEIYWNIELNGKKFNRFLSGVALLGTEMPAVSSLNTILNEYGFTHLDEIKNYDIQTDGYKLTTYAKEKKPMPKTEQEIKLEAELEAKKKEFKKLEAEIASKKDLEKELADTKAKYASSQEEIKKAEMEKQDAERKAFITKVTSAELATKAMHSHIEALLGESKKEYSIGEKKVSKEELIEDILKIAKEAYSLNTETKTTEGKSESDDWEDEQDKKIEEYAKKHNLSYGEAARVVGIVKEDK